MIAFKFLAPFALCAAALSLGACSSAPTALEVQGTPAANSKFTPLRVGMSMKQVTALIGQPTDKHSYITGKGFASVSGNDAYRQEFIYQGQGRLTFAANGGLSLESNLIRVIHNADEKGTR